MYVFAKCSSVLIIYKLIKKYSKGGSKVRIFRKNLVEKPKGQARMDNPVTQGTVGTRQRTKTNTRQKTKKAEQHELRYPLTVR